MTDSDPGSTTNITNISGGADLNAGCDITVGGDVTGRDKLESAGGHIIQAAPVSGEPPRADHRDVDRALPEYREFMLDRYSIRRLSTSL